MIKRVRIRCRYAPENDVTLFSGDCLEMLTAIPDNSTQLVVTSPPYNVGKPYERKQKLSEYLALQRKVIAQCVRILCNGGSICWQLGHHVNGHDQIIPLDLLLYPEFSKYESTDGLRLRNRIIWHFEHGLNCKVRFSGRHETVLWFTKGDDYLFNLDAIRVPQKYPGKKAYKGNRRGQYSGNPLGKNPGDVWQLPNVKANHVEKTAHPCQYPIELPARLILALTRSGDLVVDPFLGVGTTAVAAVLNSRRSAGAELMPEYVDIARNRIFSAAAGTLKYRPLNKPVYSPEANTPLTTPPPHFRLHDDIGITSTISRRKRSPERGLGLPGVPA